MALSMLTCALALTGPALALPWWNPSHNAVAPTAHDQTPFHASGPCLSVCWPEAATCPEGWENQDLGNEDFPCNTCCKKDDASSPRTAVDFAAITTQHDLMVVYPICFKVCWPEAATCPDGWENKNLRNEEHPCNTCCRKDDDSSQKVIDSAPVRAKHDLMSPFPICWRVCAREAINCPSGWENKDLGGCNTCCEKDNDDDDSESAIRPDVALKEIGSAIYDYPLCWKSCGPKDYKCPEGWENKNFGGCDTCCRKDDDDSENIIGPALTTTKPDICYRVCKHKALNCAEGWENKLIGQCNTCCMKEDKPQKDVKSAAPELRHFSVEPTCLSKCYYGGPVYCPPGFESRNFAGCYTCCKTGTTSQDLISSFSSTSDDDDNDEPQMPCYLMCAGDDLTCPGSMEKKKFGECNTCCIKSFKPSSDNLIGKPTFEISSGESSVAGDWDNDEPVYDCERHCHLQDDLDCNSKDRVKRNFAGCNVCCTKAPRGRPPLNTLSALRLLESFSSTTGEGVSKFEEDDDKPEGPCMLLCADDSLECSDKMERKKFGHCYTCCMKAEQSSVYPYFFK